MVLEELAERHGIRLSEDSLKRHGRGSINGEQAILIEPLTYMNRSGQAVRETLRYTNATADTLIVIHDDLDIAPGYIKIKMGGGSGGHNGIKSIVADIGTPEFIRVRVGIGRDITMVSSDYVLSKFDPDEASLVKEAIADAADAVEMIVREGMNKAMNVYHTRE